jgi:precorrin isomerase
VEVEHLRKAQRSERLGPHLHAIGDAPTALAVFGRMDIERADNAQRVTDRGRIQAADFIFIVGGNSPNAFVALAAQIEP